MSGFEIPSPADFASPDEVIVHHNDDAIPDSQGRIQFVAYWLPMVPGAVRGQVFRTSLAKFIANEPGPVRVVTS